MLSADSLPSRSSLAAAIDGRVHMAGSGEISPAVRPALDSSGETRTTPFTATPRSVCRV
jgi:hypothetical protein